VQAMHRSYPTSELAARERRLLPTSTLDPLAVLRSRSPTGRDGPKPERQLPRAIGSGSGPSRGSGRMPWFDPFRKFGSEFSMTGVDLNLKSHLPGERLTIVPGLELRRFRFQAHRLPLSEKRNGSRMRQTDGCLREYRL